jgi:hypothetical protein
MRYLFAFFTLTAFLSAQSAMAAERVQLAQGSIQVISCGLKDGKWKEYPTPDAARSDGATNIKAKDGNKPCGGADK